MSASPDSPRLLSWTPCPGPAVAPPPAWRQVMLTRPSHMGAAFDPDTIKGKAALVSSSSSRSRSRSACCPCCVQIHFFRAVRGGCPVAPYLLLSCMRCGLHAFEQPGARCSAFSTPPSIHPSATPLPCPAPLRCLPAPAGLRPALPPAQGGELVLPACRPRSGGWVEWVGGWVGWAAGWSGRPGGVDERVGRWAGGWMDIPARPGPALLPPAYPAGLVQPGLPLPGCQRCGCPRLLAPASTVPAILDSSGRLLLPCSC
jgi:hypothetical protein